MGEIECCDAAEVVGVGRLEDLALSCHDIINDYNPILRSQRNLLLIRVSNRRAQIKWVCLVPSQSKLRLREVR